MEFALHPDPDGSILNYPILLQKPVQSRKRKLSPAIPPSLAMGPVLVFWR